MKHTISLAVLLSALWWVLSGYAKPLLLGLGVCSVGFTLWLARRMDVVDHESHPIHISWQLARFWVRLLREIAVSNLQVVAAILSPGRHPIQPHFLRVRTRQQSALGQVLLANSITLTPGTVTVTVGDKTMLIHCLTKDAGDGLLGGDMERHCKELED